MKIKVNGRTEGKISIHTDSTVKEYNVSHEAEMIANCLYYTLDSFCVKKVLEFLSRKIQDEELNVYIKSIVTEDSPAVIVEYGTGDRAVMDLDAARDMLLGSNDEDDYYDVTDKVMEEDDE